MVGQLGFADHVVVGRRSRRQDQLSKIDTLVDWRGVAALLGPLRGAVRGRPPYAPLMLFKALLLQRWYNLSDEALEDALCDRLSFRHFVGLSLEEAIPDASTLCRFRCDLAERSLGEALFAAVAGSLDTRGLIVRQGTLIDASLISAAVAEPRKQPGGGVSALDPEASWAKKGNKATFGSVRIFVCGRAVEHQPAMAFVKRSPKMTANWAFAMVHSRGPILHSFSERFKTR